MGSTQSTSTRSEHSASGERPSSYADWFTAFALAIGGTLSLVAGVVLTSVLDRGGLAGEVAGGEITVLYRTTELTDAEAFTLVTDVVSWASIGFLVTGVVTVLFALWFAVARYRVRRRRGDGPGQRSTLSTAVFGVVVGAMTGFIPVFPAIGGTVAGYVHRDSSGSTRVGALAGLLAALPAIALLTAVMIGLTAGLFAVERPDMATLSGVTLLVALAVATAVTAGLGALGGFVGGRVGR